MERDIHFPWMLIGDLNETTTQCEKLGGTPFRGNLREHWRSVFIVVD